MYGSLGNNYHRLGEVIVPAIKLVAEKSGSLANLAQIEASVKGVVEMLGQNKYTVREVALKWDLSKSNHLTIEADKNIKVTGLRETNG